MTHRIGSPYRVSLLQRMSTSPRLYKKMYSVGDRVEVRWKTKAFPATVIHVHSAGIVNVVYDIDSSVGVFINLLGDHVNEETKPETTGVKEKRRCVVDGCPSKAYYKGQLCVKHGGKPCSVDGCTTKVMARGLCGKHGARGECRREGCTTPAATKNGVCTKHRPKLACSNPDCDTPRILGKSLCFKHGAFGGCTTDACISNAIGKRGKCRTHDSKTTSCSVEGCNNIAKYKKRGLSGLCGKHDIKKICSINNCTTAVSARGRCCRHGGGKRKVCSVDGCTTLSVARGLCSKHGAQGTCGLDGCTTNATSRSTYCHKHSGGQEACSVVGCKTTTTTTTGRHKGLCAEHGGGPCGSGYCAHPLGQKNTSTSPSLGQYGDGDDCIRV